MKQLLSELRQLDEEQLWEMTNLHPRDTGLPVIVWADSNRQMKHGLRIKFQNSYSDKTDSSSLIPMTISENPQIPVQVKLRISNADLQKIRQWIILNKDLLVAYAKEEITTKDFVNSLKTLGDKDE